MKSILGDNLTLEFDLEIPKEYMGTTTMYLFGSDTLGNVFIDSVIVNVAPISTPQNLFISFPDTDLLEIAQGFVSSVEVSCLFSDGITRNVTSLSEVNYTLKTGNARHLGDGLIKGIREGVDTLVVEYRGLSCRLPILIEFVIDYICEVVVEVSPEAAGTVEGAGEYYNNETITLTATPAVDFEFRNWTDQSGTVISEANPFTFILTQDTVIVANFNYTSITENTLTSSIRIIPNPVHQNAIIEINCLASQPNTVITILDLSGREILTVYSGMLLEGINTFPIPNHYSLANGSYFVLVENGSGRKAERFVVAR